MTTIPVNCVVSCATVAMQNSISHMVMITSKWLLWGYVCTYVCIFFVGERLNFVRAALLGSCVYILDSARLLWKLVVGVFVIVTSK